MLKKVLYVAASFMLGFMLITNVIYSNFVSVFQDNVKDAIANGNYVEAERYYSYVLENNANNKITIDDKEKSAYIEIYPSINERVYTVKNAEGNETSYQILETGISFTLFNINENFKLSDGEGVKGGIELVYDNNESLFFPFVTERLNYYEIASLYSFLPFSISNDEYNEKVALDTDGITASSPIKKVLFKDGSGDVKFEYDNSDSKLVFDTKLYSDFNVALTEFANVKKDAAVNSGSVDESVNEQFLKKINAIADADANYIMMHEQNVIFKSAKFLIPVILTSVGFLALDIAVAWLLFRKKKVVNSKPTQVTPKQPEQFSRDIFDAEESSVSETTDEVEEENNTQASEDE